MKLIIIYFFQIIVLLIFENSFPQNLIHTSPNINNINSFSHQKSNFTLTLLISDYEPLAKFKELGPSNDFGFDLEIAMYPFKNDLIGFGIESESSVFTSGYNLKDKIFITSNKEITNYSWDRYHAGGFFIISYFEWYIKPYYKLGMGYINNSTYKECAETFGDTVKQNSKYSYNSYNLYVSNSIGLLLGSGNGIQSNLCFEIISCINSKFLNKKTVVSNILCL